MFDEPAEGAGCKPTAASDTKRLPAALACVLGDTLLAPMLLSAKELVVEPASGGNRPVDRVIAQPLSAS